MDRLAVSPNPRALGGTGLVVGPWAWAFRPLAGTRPADAARALAAAVSGGAGLVTVSDAPWAGGTTAWGADLALLADALAEAPEAARQAAIALRAGLAPQAWDHRPQALTAQVDEALRLLKRERIELLILQRTDPLVHPEGLARTLGELVAAGKVGGVGLAHHPLPRIAFLARLLGARLGAIEVPFSALDPAPLFDGTLDYALERGLGVIAAAPLAEGRVGDRPDLATSVAHRATLRALDAVADREGVPRAVVAAAFVAVHPAEPIPLFGTQDPTELAGLARIFTIGLERGDWYRILEAAMGGPLPMLDPLR
ncbi:MAG: aldo/keto reductase [Sphingomonadaceae bacterium]|uniref:aldo/keto reductase n=1 Tax=Thermaurantiacus sp. TaxID=2820283 RepID=UPI00298EF61C|nr:aldo/keto reductase [Thermaurantiacus sp.]MCS6986120.1 aldo/keto reductase [Sphingomonadaceae bacterium]MDW8414664.1 aldo/keto reductase [Thermaurantiacus sp.]